MAISFDDLKLLAIPKVKSCPPQVITQRLQWAARRFLNRSEIWRHDQTQDVVADQEDYNLTVPTTNAEVKRIHGAWYGSESDKKLTESRIDEDDYEIDVSGSPVVLSFYNAYTSALTDGLTTELVCIPDIAYTDEIPGYLMDEWGIRGFLELALWDLKNDEDQPWEDKEGAKRHQVMFARALANAQRMNVVKRKQGDLRVRARWFA